MEFDILNSGKVEKKRLLRWGLYVILGLIVAQSAWVIASQSIAHGRYSPIVFMSVMVGTVIATIYLERKYRGVKFQFYHPWRIPRLTTRGILWMIAIFDAVVMGVFLVIVIGSAGLVFRDGTAVSLLQLPALLLVLPRSHTDTGSCAGVMSWCRPENPRMRVGTD